jgi:hypothetical protein
MDKDGPLHGRRDRLPRTCRRITLCHAPSAPFSPQWRRRSTQRATTMNHVKGGAHGATGNPTSSPGQRRKLHREATPPPSPSSAQGPPRPGKPASPYPVTVGTPPRPSSPQEGEQKEIWSYDFTLRQDAEPHAAPPHLSPPVSQIHTMPTGYLHRQAGHARHWPHKSVTVAGDCWLNDQSVGNPKRKV